MNHFGYYVLNLQPTILSYIGSAHPAPPWLRPAGLIEHLAWWHGRPYPMIKRKVDQLHHERPGILHGLMVNSPDEESMRRLFRVEGSYVSHQIYLDHDTLVPKQCSKIYRAVYVAVLQPYKRHYLASELQQTLMIPGGDLREVDRYRSLVPNASFNDRRLSRVEIAETISSASCTLALSKVEGAMLASFESLLCGVPVVSTPSKGGRDVFFDSYNSLIVKPTPQAVAEGVEHFHSNQPDPHVIRAKALEVIEPHKRRLCTYVSGLAVRLGGRKIDPDERYQRYFGAFSGISNLFIWADKFERAEDVERIQAKTFIG